MEGYLGQTIIPHEESKFKDYDKSDWALYFIEQYGSIDGSHHKDWVLDQVARVLKGTPVIIKLARWSNGFQEYRVDLGEPSKEYLDWVAEITNGEDGPDTYAYSEGIAP